VALSCTIAAPLFVSVLHAQSQAATAEAALSVGVARVRAGDLLGALITLNDVIDQYAAQPDATPVVARAHAYKAIAYLRLEQPERARSAAQLALQADPNVQLDARDATPEVTRLLAGVHRPREINPEAAGASAEQAGRFQEAFVEYLNAYRALSDPPSPADDRRLRERIITVVEKLPTAPLIPQDARESLAKAEALLEADAVLGGSSGAGATQAASELRKAVRIAPWWPEATFTLATVLQQLQRVDEALLNLNLYRLADPRGYAAAADPRPVGAANDRALPAPDATPTSARPATAASGRIIIYWPKQFGTTKDPKVFCNGEHVADFEDGHFLELQAPPGMHTLEAEGKKTRIGVEPGQDRYVRGHLGMFKLSLRPATPEEATHEIREKQISANDPKRTFARACPAPAPQRAGKSKDHH
jgi:tetratricopeptide (TPR) repeat protein